MARPSMAGDTLLQEDRIKSQRGYSPETGRTTCSSRSRCDGGGWCSVVSNPVSDSESIRQWPQILRANGGKGGLSIDGDSGKRISQARAVNRNRAASNSGRRAILIHVYAMIFVYTATGVH
jgi:hypothetical protein